MPIIPKNFFQFGAGLQKADGKRTEFHKNSISKRIK